MVSVHDYERRNVNTSACAKLVTWICRGVVFVYNANANLGNGKVSFLMIELDRLLHLLPVTVKE